MNTGNELQDNESEYSMTKSDRSKQKRHVDRRRRKNQGSPTEIDDGEKPGEKSVKIRTPSIENNSRFDEGPTVVDMPENENWNETNTFISGTTDVTQLSHESLAKLTKDEISSVGFHDCGFICMVLFSLVSYLSPIAIVLLPYIWLTHPITTACQTSCKGILIGMAFKLILLLIASWAIFFRRQRTNMPRVFMFRVLILFLVAVLTITYWLFFVVWIVDEPENNYQEIASFADSFTNCLLFVHYLSLVMLELRHLQTMFVLEVIRTTDGERKFYNVGDLSIQRCSVWVLEKYYCDFPLYNPALLRTPSRSSRMKQLNNQKFKVYDVDGGQPSNDKSGQTRAMMAAVARRRDAGHNERYYEEVEYERRVRKRRARLVAATEDAFAHIRRLSEDEIGKPSKSFGKAMEAKDAAEAIFPALARALQKYLRTTRQHQHYDIEGIIDHLANCIKNDMTPKAFLQRYLHSGPYLTYSPRHDSSQWQLISDEPLVNMIKDGTVFKLDQNEYSLVVVVHKSPRIRLKEEFIDPSSHRFALQMQSETSL